MNRPRTPPRVFRSRPTLRLSMAAVVACLAPACAKLPPEQHRAPAARPSRQQLVPGGFEENRGQFSEPADFVAQDGDRMLALGATEVTMMLRNQAVAPDAWNGLSM